MSKKAEKVKEEILNRLGTAFGGSIGGAIGGGLAGATLGLFGGISTGMNQAYDDAFDYVQDLTDNPDSVANPLAGIAWASTAGPFYSFINSPDQVLDYMDQLTLPGAAIGAGAGALTGATIGKKILDNKIKIPRFFKESSYLNNSAMKVLNESIQEIFSKKLEG